MFLSRSEPLKLRARGRDRRAATYSPSYARFLQADPIGYGDGMNMYGYVQGDPVNLTDPWGLSAEGREIIVTGTRSYYGVSPSTGPIGQGSGTIFGNDLRFISGESPPNDDIDGDGQPDPDIVVTAKRPTPQKVDNKIIVAAKKAAQCAANQFGLGELGEAAAVAAGQPIPGTKPFVTPGSSRGTSVAGMAANKVFGRTRLPVRIPTIVGGPGTGRALAIAGTKSAARFAGRAVPIVGWVLLAYDAGSILLCTASD